MSNPVQNAMLGLYSALYRLTNGAIGGHVSGLDVLLLTSTGSRSGQARTTPLGFLRDGGGYVIIASNGGSDRHPAWYFNLRKTPDARVRIRGASSAVRAEVLTGDERARALEQVVSTSPGYARYQQKAHREIPLVRLTPLPS